MARWCVCTLMYPWVKLDSSHLMVYGPKGSLVLLKQILRCWMSLNMHICPIRQSSWNFTTVSISFPVKLVVDLYSYNMEMRTSKERSSIWFLSKILNFTNVLTPHFYNFIAIVFNLLVHHKTFENMIDALDLDLLFRNVHINTKLYLKLTYTLKDTK